MPTSGPRTRLACAVIRLRYRRGRSRGRIGPRTTHGDRCVPGVRRSRRGATPITDVYGRIAATGAQFINHGNRATPLDPRQGHNVSSFFFDSAEPAVVQRDIVAGDRALREILGVETDGFRAPHFGTFQRPRQLRWLHQVLRSELCYRFSTSTVPLWSFRYGAVFERFGLPEVPLTGGVEAPFNILDTWGFFAAPNRSRTAADFEREATLLAETFAGLGVGVITWPVIPPTSTTATSSSGRSSGGRRSPSLPTMAGCLTRSRRRPRRLLRPCHARPA